MKKLSIIIVNYNVCYFLEQTLKSVMGALKNIEAEVFVIDNNSVDGSVEMTRKKFPEVILIENKVNVGFSKANNQGIRIAKGEYVLLLNPDTVVQEDTFIKCCDFMDHHADAGGLGVYMVDGKGIFLPESKRGLPTPWVAFYKIVGLSRFFPRSEKFGRYHLGYLDKEQTHAVEILSGAYMFLRKSVLDKIGYLDEDYFMYGEDIDLSYRIIKSGFKNYYFPETRIIHYKGESTKKSSVNYVIVFYSAMIIFAQKHFSGAFAGIFTLLIKSAIYARAAFSLVSRTLKQIAFPLLNALIIFLGMALIKTYWENNFKAEPGRFPDHFLYIVIPSYIIVWLLSIFYNGGFDKPYKSYRIIRGVIIGTLLISTVTNFVDSFRYSKAIILIGSFWTIIAIIAIRYFVHFIKFRKLNFDEDIQKKVVIVGGAEESNRVVNLIRSTDMKATILGYISTENYTNGHENYLGNIGNVNDIIKIYKADEVIFCSKNIGADRIIETMTQIDSRLVDFKIVPDNSNFILGSNSKDSNGELYTMEVKLSIINKNNIRNKRMLDLTTTVLFILASPALIFFIKGKAQFFKNLFGILIGRFSMVGFTTKGQIHLPKIKVGILNPISEFNSMKLDEQTILKLDLIYAKDYKTVTDLNIILSCFRQLDKHF